MAAMMDAEALRAKLAEVEAERDALRAHVAEVESERDEALASLVEASEKLAEAREIEEEYDNLWEWHDKLKQEHEHDCMLQETRWSEPRFDISRRAR